ncbi:MAG: DUF58 domain-containing protein [Phycisphaerales bacterium]
MIASLPRPPESVDDLLPPALAAALERADVLSRKVFAGKLQGERRSKRRGRSVEFDDYREYVPGDDLRHIDWNVFARLDRFFIKLFQEEEDLSVHVVVDASLSMHAGAPSKALTATRLAMALGYIGLVRNNRVLVSVLGGGVAPLRRLAPCRGRRNIRRIGEFLLESVFARGVPAGGSEAAASPPAPLFADALRQIAASRVGRGVVLLFSDLLIPKPEGYGPGLRYLSAGARTGLDVTVVQVLSPGELDPEREGRGDGEARLQGDLRLTDVETGRGAEVTLTAELAKVYAARAHRYVDECAAFCAARGMQHLLVQSDADIGGVLLRTLRQRGVLR